MDEQRRKWLDSEGEPAPDRPAELPELAESEGEPPAASLSFPSGELVTIGTAGHLASLLGAAEVRLEFDGPTRLVDVLLDCAERFPKARPLLFVESRILPTTWRRGEPLHAKDLVYPGDRLDLVVVLAGG